MTRKFLGFIDKDPVILFHYLYLVGILYLAHYLIANRFFNLEALTITSPVLGYILMTIWYYVWFLIADNAFHTATGHD